MALSLIRTQRFSHTLDFRNEISVNFTNLRSLEPRSGHRLGRESRLRSNRRSLGPFARACGRCFVHRSISRRPAAAHLPGRFVRIIIGARYSTRCIELRYPRVHRRASVWLMERRNNGKLHRGMSPRRGMRRRLESCSRQTRVFTDDPPRKAMLDAILFIIVPLFARLSPPLSLSLSLSLSLYLSLSIYVIAVALRY